jgi:putative transposase
MATHFDYIHYNPVKHGLVRSPAEWQFSSFHDYAAAGYYESDWEVHEPENIRGDFGE